MSPPTNACFVGSCELRYGQSPWVYSSSRPTPNGSRWVLTPLPNGYGRECDNGKKGACFSKGKIGCSGTCIPTSNVQPAREKCGNLDDEDCDGVLDNGCGETRPTPGPGGGRNGPPPGPSDNFSGCLDQQGRPVDMVTGAVTVGPLTLVSARTPFDIPLQLQLSYDSRLGPGPFGDGFRLNLEQRVQDISVPMLATDGGVASKALVAYFGPSGGEAFFPKPTDAAWDESTPLGFGGTVGTFDPARTTRSLDGFNLAYYESIVEWQRESCWGLVCDLKPVVRPRVGFDDGSRALFDADGRLASLEDRYGNRTEVQWDTTGPWPMPKQVKADRRSVTLTRAANGSSIDMALLIDGLATPRVRLVFDATGTRLTDICDLKLSPGAGVGQGCALPGENTWTGCGDLRTLWRFHYAQTADGPKLSTIQDESCAVVEQHDYVDKGTLGVVASTSKSATESLSFDWSDGGGQFVTTTSYVRPDSPPAGSQEAPSFGPAMTTVSTSFNRVQSAQSFCGGGGQSAVRVWEVIGGVPQVTTIELEGLRRINTIGGEGDPFNFHLTTTVREDDRSSAAASATPSRTTSFVYAHPSIRRPTGVHRLNAGLDVAVTTWDFDDDDVSFPCRDGVTPSPPSPAPNSAPTAFLCRVRQESYLPYRDERLTRYRYDARGRVLEVDGPGGPVRYAYYSDNVQDGASAGMLHTVTRLGPVALVTTYADYTADGLAQRVVGPNGNAQSISGPDVTVFEFDSRGRVQKIVEPDGATTFVAWLSDRRPLQVIRSFQGVVSYEYELGSGGFGRLKAEKWRVSVSGPILQQRTYTWDKGGNPVLVVDTDATGTATRVQQRDFDYAHRIIREFGLPATVAKSWQYGDRFLESVTDELGRQTVYAFDGFGGLRSRTDPGGVTSSFLYDSGGNLVQTADGNGNETAYSYDGFGAVRTVSTPDTGTTEYAYGPDGQIAFMADAQHFAEGSFLRFVRDSQGRLTMKQLLTAPSRSVCHFGWKDCGQPAASRVAGLERYIWDTATNGLDRLARVEVEGGQATDFSYDSAGRRASESRTPFGWTGPALTLGYEYFVGGALWKLRYPASTTVAGTGAVVLSRDALENVTGVSWNGKSLATGVLHYPFGGLRGFTRGNGLATGISEDTLGRRDGVAGGPVAMSYSLGPSGDVDAIQEGGDVYRARSYGYTTERELSDVTHQDAKARVVMSESYTYDKAGNRLERVRNGRKVFTSFFDRKADGKTPANNLLRAVVDPFLDGGCPAAAGWDGGTRGGEDEEDEREGEGHGEHGDGSGEGHHHRLDAGIAGTPSPVCGRSPAQQRAMQRGWERLVEQAEHLVEALPSLPSSAIRAKAQTLLDATRGWMAEWDVTPQALLLVASSVQSNGVDVSVLLQRFLERRLANGNALYGEDLNLLRQMMELLERVDVTAASAADPTWRFEYDAAGNATAESLEMPIGNRVTGPAWLHVLYCYRYDGQRHLTQVEFTGYATPLAPGASEPKCGTGTYPVMARYQYDEAARRTYSWVAGVERWEVRGDDGLLLAELDAAGAVTRAYVYLDGEPLAQVVLNAGETTRPTPVKGAPVAGCSSTTASSPLEWAGLGLAAWALALRRRRVRGPSSLSVAAAGLALLLSGCGGGDITVDAGPLGANPTEAPGDDPIYYYHNDRMGTPVRMTGEDGGTVWRAEYAPFGGLESLETDPDGDGVSVENNLRLPGQYDDALASLLMAGGPYYNWHRQYSPDLGRYLSPEPLLQGPEYPMGMAYSGRGVPTYAYAGNNPISEMDPTGLWTIYLQCPGMGGLHKFTDNDPYTRIPNCMDCIDARLDAELTCAEHPAKAPPKGTFEEWQAIPSSPQCTCAWNAANVVCALANFTSRCGETPESKPKEKPSKEPSVVACQ